MCKKVLIDTNILLDVLIKREEFFEYSSALWKQCEAGQTEGVISALSIANITYILRKQLDTEKTAFLISGLSQIFGIADLKAGDIRAAAETGMPDYEDALQACCARRIGAEFIITRNVKDFKQSPVPAVTPEEFLEKYI